MPRRVRGSVPGEDATPTAVRLREAAMAEFNAHGFAGTDSNRIARRAGFAPQTFYRWYQDKTEVFIACYRAWWDEEEAVLQALFDRDAPSEALVEAGVAHHRRHLMFRRSLRQLSIDDPAVRRARAESRLRQVAQLRAWTRADFSDEQLAVMFFQFERLADAIAEGELADMGLGETEARRLIAGLVDQVRGRA
jgi:AcrR family transcriptional regulator